MMQRQITVELGNRSYPITIGRGLESDIKQAVHSLSAKRRPVLVITDSEVAVKQRPFLSECFGDHPVWTLPAGESSKNLVHFAEALEFMASSGLDRSTTVFAFGGGVVGDFAGYVAASYMRGVDFIQIPTTLLSMVDSSVGGKTGVNLKAGKNLVGAFHQPKAVFIDIARLDTLPSRQFASGMAEIIKAGMLADISFFETLECLGKLDPTSPALPDIIQRACEIKAGVVAADEKESAASGGRALLNLGHTFGHAIEQCTGYTRYLHGEAIAIGIMMACKLSEDLGYLSANDTSRVRHLLETTELPIRLAESLSRETLHTAMGRDKKKKQGSLKYVVLEHLGQAITRADIDLSVIDDALAYGGAEESDSPHPY